MILTGCYISRYGALNVKKDFFSCRLSDIVGL